VWRAQAGLVVSPLLLAFAPSLLGQETAQALSGTKRLKNLTLEELSKIELTTVSTESTDAFRTPAAISVLTRQDIARSGATNTPALRRKRNVGGLSCGERRFYVL